MSFGRPWFEEIGVPCFHFVASQLGFVGALSVVGWQLRSWKGELLTIVVG